jgi:hypothetical protein
VSIGDTEAHGIVGYLWTGLAEVEPVAENIGLSVLRNFNVTFDATRGAMYLEKSELGPCRDIQPRQDYAGFGGAWPKK